MDNYYGEPNNLGIEKSAQTNCSCGFVTTYKVKLGRATFQTD